MTSATYRVTGMTCEHCVRAVSGELRALDGVSDVAIELVPGGACVVTVTSDGPLPRRPSRMPSTKPATTSSPEQSRPPGGAWPPGQASGRAWYPVRSP